MSKTPDNPWFRVKRHGYGADLPLTWQGWLLLGGFIAGSILAGLFLPVTAFILFMAVATPAVVLIARKKSNDEWRWRDGSEQ